MKKKIILPLIMLSLGLFGLGSCDLPLTSSPDSSSDTISESSSTESNSSNEESSITESSSSSESNSSNENSSSSESSSSSSSSTSESSSSSSGSSSSSSSSESSSSSSEIIVTHNYGTTWEKDETHHWHACLDEGCNEISDEAVHIGGEATETEKAVCEVCGESYGSLKPHEHAYTVELAEEEYLVSEADCDSKAVYKKSCACGEAGTETFESGEPLGHDYTTSKTNSTHHWVECDCGAKDGEEEHVYSTLKTSSTHHWNECECGEKLNETAHSYTISKHNDTHHWDECECGAKDGEEEHIYASGRNETHHWQVCECGQEINKTEHKLTYAYTNDGALKYTGSCTCGYTVHGDVEGDTLEVSTEADLKMVLSSNYNVILSNDIELTSTIELEGEIEVELDLNGKALSLHRENPEAKENVEVIWVKSGAKLTIKGEGTLSATSGEDTNVEHYVGVVSSTDGAYVRIENGSFYSNGCTAIYATRNGVVDIYGGRFEATENYEGRLFTLDINEAETEGLGVIKVYGGTYVNFDPAKDAVDGKGNENKVQEGYCSVKVDNTYVVDEHVEVTLEKVDATCTTKGLTEGTKCSRCNAVLEAQEEINALGHDYNSVVTAPTCTSVGYTTNTCKVCEHSYTTDEVAKVNHNYEAVVTAPTCISVGYTTYTCSECDDSYTADEVEKIDHSYTKELAEDAYLAKAADCENAAKYYKLCSGCDLPSTNLEDIYESGNALGHDDSGEWYETENNTAHYKICGREGCSDEIEYGTHDGTGSMTKLAKCSACGKEHGKYQVTVSYLNTNGWSKVYVYAFSTAESTHIKYAWPGTEVQKGTNFYNYTIESDKSLEGLKVIFNNGSGGTGNQTDDLVVSEGYSIFYGNSTTGYNFKDENHTLTIYFTKPDSSWGDSINAHMWKDNGKGTTWPGVDAPWVEQNSYGKEVYGIAVDIAEYTKIIFNGNGKQTSDLVIPGDGNNAVYLGEDNITWIWTKDTSHN